MTAPGPWAFALLAAAAVRCWWLVALDSILDRPRSWLDRRSAWAGDLVGCPWCSGAWIAAAWWAAWTADAGVATWAATPFAISAAVGLGAHLRSA